MLLSKIKAEGLAHLSYIIRSQNSAAVIDPRRDIDIYLKIAEEKSSNVTHTFETHQNEDYVIGSIPLSEKTGANIYHGSNLDFTYGNPVKDGDEFEYKQKNGLQVLDTRSPEAIIGSSIPGSFAIPLSMVPAFGGWFLSYDEPIGLVMHFVNEIETALRYLYRLGYDNIAGYLANGMYDWEVTGKPYQCISSIHAAELIKKKKMMKSLLSSTYTQSRSSK